VVFEDFGARDEVYRRISVVEMVLLRMVSDNGEYGSDVVSCSLFLELEGGVCLLEFMCLCDDVLFGCELLVVDEEWVGKEPRSVVFSIVIVGVSSFDKFDRNGGELVVGRCDGC